MANRFWIGDTGSWSDTAHWSASSGGAGGASVPGSTDDVTFDAASFSATSVVTVPGNNYVTPFTMGRNITFAAIDQSISLSLTSVSNGRFNIHGNLTLSSLITSISGTAGPIINFAGAGTMTLTSSGAVFYAVYVEITDGGTLALGDAFQNLYTSGPRGISVQGGTFNSNSHAITCSSFEVIGNFSAATANLGTSLITIDVGTSTTNPSGANDYTFSISADGSFAATVDADATTIIIQAGQKTTIFQPGGAVFHNVTIKGDGTNATYINKFTSVDDTGTFDSLTIQTAPVTITLYNTSFATPIVATTFIANGSSGKLITFQTTQQGLLSGGTISDSGFNYTVGDTFTLGGLDSWRVDTVDGSGSVLTVTLTDSGPDSFNDGIYEAVGGTGNGLEIEVILAVIQQSIQATSASVSYVDVSDNYAQGDIPFIGNPSGSVDSSNTTNWFPDPGTLPEYNTSLISSVSRTQQNLSFPRFIIGGAGGADGTDYALFKKTDTGGFNLFRTKSYEIGKDFDVMGITFNLIADLDANTEIIPVLHFDDDTSQVVGTTINSTNYSDKFIQLAAKNFGNSVHGKDNFFLEFQFTGSTLSPISLPINIDVDILDT